MTDLNLATPPSPLYLSSLSFFSTDTATTNIYTLSLHDALPIYRGAGEETRPRPREHRAGISEAGKQGKHHSKASAVLARPDRKSTRLNSSHPSISYAVFCLKKKTTYNNNKYFS